MTAISATSAQSGRWVYYARLVSILARRDLVGDLKDTSLGLLWIVLQPLLLMVTFSIIKSFLKFGEEGIPYPLTSFLAIALWIFHASILQRAIPSIERNAGIIKKMPVPRILFPLSAVVVCLVEYAVTWVPMLGLIAYYQWHLGAGMLYLPLMVGLLALFSLGLGLILASIGIFKRDVVMMLPYSLQLWMFLSPVIYPISHVPEAYRGLYALNPMVGIVEGARNAVLKNAPPDWALLQPTLIAIAIVWVLALLLYPRMSRYFADVL